MIFMFGRKKQKDEQKALVENRDQIAKALEILFTADYISKRKLYWENFLRGMAFSAGGVIGATVIITLLLWILSIFDNIPLIGPVFNNTKNTIQAGQE